MKKFITYITQLFTSLLIKPKENNKFSSHPLGSGANEENNQKHLNQGQNKENQPKNPKTTLRAPLRISDSLRTLRQSTSTLRAISTLANQHIIALSSLRAISTSAHYRISALSTLRAIFKFSNHLIFKFSLFLLLAFATPKLFAQPFTTVFPKDNVEMADSSITFQWNKFDNYINYKLEISQNSSFSTIYYSGSLANNSQETYLFNTFGIYYWRVKGYSALNDSIISNTNKIELFSPKSVPGLQAWFNPDYGITTINGKITQWNDISGLNRTATQSDTSKAPKLITNAYNGHPTIQYDGDNDFIKIDDSLNINSVSVLSSWNGAETAFSANQRTIITCNGTNPDDFFIIGQVGTSDIYGTGYLGNMIFVNGSKTRNYSPLNRYKVVGGFNPISKSYSGTKLLRMGHDGSYQPWKGWIPEVILYNNSSMDSLILKKINIYYFNKYSPPVNLGSDIKVAYGFCDTLLSASANHLSSYIWNTGETTPKIRVNQSGMYWVQTTDMFGFISRDTIQVHFTAVVEIPNSIICFGDTSIINLNIGSPYTYSWSNGQTTSQFTETQLGTYHVAITDTNLCVYRDTFNVVIDSLPTKLWLGNDTSICLGNPLGYQLLNYTQIDGLSGGYRYLWSTGDTTATTAINATNNYSLQLTNLRGCIARDTVTVTLQGIPPTTQFTQSADSICSGNTLTFTDLTVGAVSRSWTIGEGAPRTDSTFSYTYTTPGVYNIELTTSATNGCPRIASKTLRVNPSPTVNFTTEPACIGLPTQFTNNATPGSNDSIVLSSWNFNDPTSGIANTSTLTNPQHQFTSAGTFTPQLIVTTKKGCSTASSRTVEVVSSEAFPQPFTLIYPQTNALLVDSSVTFQWNESVNGYTYLLQIATDNLFSNIIYTSALQKTNSLSFPFTNFGIYYWRVTAQNSCGNSTPSQINKLELFSPKQISGLQAWFNPDYGITQINGKITQWNDVSGLNRTATQSDTSKAPKLISNKFNGHPTIEYDGNNDVLIIEDSLNVNAVSLLSAWNGTNTVFTANQRTIITCNGTNPADFFIIGQVGSSSIFNSGFLTSFYINGNKTSNYTPLNKYKIIGSFNSITSKAYSGSKTLRIGHDGSYQPWQGWIPEIILYNNLAMDSVTLAKLNDYFYAKYAPPVSLGYDIKVQYKLCDTLLSATANHFTNYLWSTGDTTGAISVSRSGSYWVRATNIFGQISSDTVEVYFAAKRTLPDTTVCMGNSYQYNWTPLTNYTLSWSNGNVGSTFSETQAGTFAMLLTDTLGCTYRDTFNLYVDSLAMRMSLGNDTSLCRGNTLNFALDNYTLQNPQFLWNNGSTLSTIQVSDTGNYWLQITNGRGCIVRDTIHINIKGNAPVVSFTAPGKCLGETTPLSDLSYCTDASVINAWQWNFGDGNTSTSQNPSHHYASDGIYPITLTVTTDSNCSNTITIPTVVYSLPIANFSPITGCNNTPIQFSDQSISLDGYTLDNWNWNFGDAQSGGNNTSSAQHPVHQFDTSGVYQIKIKVISNVGCSDSIQKAFVIKPSPIANFTISNTCEGATTWFSDSSITESWNNIISRRWEFSDGYTSSQLTVSKRYPEAGAYPVNYIIQSVNGCSDTLLKDAIVHPNPTANFTANSFCLNQPVILESSSSIQDDILNLAQWEIGNNLVLTGTPISFMLDSAKTYPVRLVVSSAHSCKDTITKEIIIKPIPEASFSFLYNEATIGNSIQFINNTDGENSYEWQTEGTVFSTIQSPTYDFGDAGIYTVFLIAKNSVACTDSAHISITVVNPNMDIAVADLSIIPVGNYQQAAVNLINMSNRNITDLWITLQLNEVEYRERWHGMIRSGEVIPYTFATQLYLSPSENVEYGCVKIASPLFSTETNLDNNEVCIAMGESFKIIKLYPNPASEFIHVWASAPYQSEAQIRILSTSGTEVQSWTKLLSKGVNQLKFPLINIGNGLYILEVEFKNKTERIKFNVVR